MFTQTADQASAKLLRFPTKATCQAFLDDNNIAASPHNQGTHYIAVFFDRRGAFGVSSATTGELLPEW